MTLKTIAFLIEFAFFCSPTSKAALLIFEVDAVVAEVSGIRNCSCILGSPTCTSTALLASPFCFCTTSSATDISKVAENAKISDTVSWWNVDPLTICCESVSGTPNTRQLLNNLIYYSHTSRLTLTWCENLVPETNEYITVYGLQETSILTVSAANNPTQFISMTDTDRRLSDPRSREYRDFHIAFIDEKLLDGNSLLKSWSVWTDPEVANTEIQQTAIARAPESIKAKTDKNIMFTMIYG